MVRLSVKELTHMSDYTGPQSRCDGSWCAYSCATKTLFQPLHSEVVSTLLLGSVCGENDTGTGLDRPFLLHQVL